jgi:hypothetical protein
MADDAARRAFEELDDEQLLATATFFLGDYAWEGQQTLLEVARNRRIDVTNPRVHRERCWPGVDLEFDCDGCGKRLRIDRAAFVEGTYACPLCRHNAPVAYDRLEASPTFLQFVIGSRHPLQGAFQRRAKQVDRREAIVNGTYWTDLRAMPKPPV